MRTLGKRVGLTPSGVRIPYPPLSVTLSVLLELATQLDLGGRTATQLPCDERSRLPRGDIRDLSNPIRGLRAVDKLWSRRGVRELAWRAAVRSPDDVVVSGRYP